LLRPLLCLTFALVLASPVGAQKVLLQVRPRVGDTLHMRLDQEVQQSGTTREGQADTTMQVLSRLRVLSRSVVERSDPTATTVLSITDSVTVSTTGFSADAFEQARRSLQGQRMRMRVAADGAVAVLDGPDGASGELRGVLEQMPATLPREPIAVGAHWLRTMNLPLSGESAEKGAGVLRTTFHFDSLSRDQMLAYLSMRGVIAHAPDRDEHDGLRYDMSGTVIGSIVVDRRRGWMTSSRSVMTVHSVVRPPAGSAAQPMHFRMTVTQDLRTRS
jgi:hypothetical protein